MAKTLRSRIQRAYIAVLIGCRKEAKLTQRDLAERLGRPHSYISKIETGERRLDVGEFVEYAKAVGIDPVRLFKRVLAW